MNKKNYSYIFQCTHLKLAFLMYVYIYMYIYLVICMYIPHPRSQHSQGQEKFLAPSADKQTCSYDTECSNHHLPLSILGSKGLGGSKMNGEPYIQIYQ